MATIPSAVTATGSDRSRLLADLTMRLGRIDVISEREVTLPDGNAGWEVTVRHQPFVGAGPTPEEAADGEALRAQEAEAADAARAELAQLRAQIGELERHAAE